MVSNPLKALPLAMLLAFPAAAAPSGDDPPEKKTEKRVVVTDDGVFASDGEDAFWKLPRLPRRNFLGVRLLEMTPELREHFGAPRHEGILVAAVETDSPAARSGVHVGDIITRADGEPIESGADLSRAVRRARAGETLKIEVSRDRATRQIPVKLEERRGAELDLGDLGRSLGRHAWVFRDHPETFRDRPENLDRFQRRLEDLEKRLKDLEKKLPAR